MFSGHYQHGIDDKGRVAIPIDFRGAPSGLQGERLFITKFRVEGRPCLDAYPVAAWQRLQEKLATKNRFDPEVMRFRRAYVSAARECLIDAQGRILIPPLLRQYAGLKRDVMFTGETDYFQIWDRDAWQSMAVEDERIFDDPQRMKALDL